MNARDTAYVRELFERLFAEVSAIGLDQDSGASMSEFKNPRSTGESERDGSSRAAGAERPRIAAMANVHSHAFRRDMHGAAERISAAAAGDDFWSWRRAMFDTVAGLDPDSTLNGYIPAGLTMEQAAALRGSDPDEYLRRVGESVLSHVGAIRALQQAGEKVKFQGLPSRICWLGYGERHLAGPRFNEMVASGELKAPIVIGRDHLDTGSVASPQRETEAMLDGSDAYSPPTRGSAWSATPTRAIRARSRWPLSTASRCRCSRRADYFAPSLTMRPAAALSRAASITRRPSTASRGLTGSSPWVTSTCPASTSRKRA